VLPALGVALATFFLASPAILLQPARFLEQAHRQLFVIPSQGSGLAFEQTGNGYAFLFLGNLPVVLGWPLWVATMGGIAWAVARAWRALRRGEWRTPSAELAGDAVSLTWLFLLFVPLGMSVLLGAFFVSFQGIEWLGLIREGLTMTSSAYGAFFYLIVGTHALHAVIAISCLAWAWFRLRDRRLSETQFKSVQIFWYFVVLVWPIIYFQVYQ